MKIGDIVSHKQYGVGSITQLPPGNPLLAKAVFATEDEEKIVIIKNLKIAKPN